MAVDGSSYQQPGSTTIQMKTRIVAFLGHMAIILIPNADDDVFFEQEKLCAGTILCLRCRRR